MSFKTNRNISIAQFIYFTKTHTRVHSISAEPKYFYTTVQEVIAIRVSCGDGNNKQKLYGSIPFIQESVMLQMGVVQLPEQEL